MKKTAGVCARCDGVGARVNPEWLRDQRRKSGRSQSEVAKELQVSASFLCDVELGRREISVRHRIAERYERFPL